jgi:hypothetical protein
LVAFKVTTSQCPVVILQEEVVQLLGAVQILGVYKHVPVKGLQEANVQGFGGVQTTLILLHFPLEQESTVQLLLSLQLTA